MIRNSLQAVLGGILVLLLSAVCPAGDDESVIISYESAVGLVEKWLAAEYPTPIAREVATEPLLEIVRDKGVPDNKKLEKMLKAFPGAFSSLVADIRQKAEGGEAQAQYRLGRCYDTGFAVAEDKDAAVRWYRKAAEQGVALAQCNLGVCYANGYGVAQDKAAAVRWYRTAAEQGLAEAQYNLGVCYADGVGVAEDKAAAVRWYRKAAEQGVALAQFNLGVCYDDGVGVAEDKAAAVRWYRKAAEQGYAPAKRALSELGYEVR